MEGVSYVCKRYGERKRQIVETKYFYGVGGGLSGEGTHYWRGDNFEEIRQSSMANCFLYAARVQR